jgi:hypothetical protein
VPAFVNNADLRTEAIVFGRYLVGSEPGEALIDRYCRANETLFADAPASDADHAVLDFARRHAWAVPMLDAAAGVTGGGESLLRKKLLVMTAIVETTPENVERTEQRSVGLPRLAMRVGVAGARAAFHVATGLVLTAALRRPKR